MANDFDVVVIGAGGAGLSTAVTAAESGLSVLVVESEKVVGGSTRLSQGVFSAACTSVQRALGIDDSVDKYFDYYMTLNAWRQPAALVYNFCKQSGPTLDWLISLGVEVPHKLQPKPQGCIWPAVAVAPGLYNSGAESVPRGHWPVEGGQSYIDVLDQRAAVLGVETVLNTRVRALLLENGGIVGVDADGFKVRCGAVAVTCGGFARNLEMIREYYPDAVKYLRAGEEPVTSTQAPGARGDAIAFAKQIGADITGFNCGLVNTGPEVQQRPGVNPQWLGFPPTSLVYVNNLGRRFTDESAPYAVMPALIELQDNVVWGIFDERERQAMDSVSGGIPSEMILDLVRSGDFMRAQSLDELAAICHLPAETLRREVVRYNEDLPTGTDREYRRNLSGLHPIAEGPFYAFKNTLNYVNLTGAGMRIDAEARALDLQGDPIPGLYAAGEAGAGVLGQRYVGGGNSIANALTMGRIAGKAIARRLQDNSSVEPEQ